MTWEQWFDVTRAFRNMGGDWSFTKLLVCYFCAASWLGHAPSALVMGLLMAAAFGKSTFEGWLQSNTSSETETTTNSTQTILERRVIDNGISFEPSP